MKWKPYEVLQKDGQMCRRIGFNPSYEMEALRRADSYNSYEWFSYVSILLMKWKPYEENARNTEGSISISFNPSYEMEALRSPYLPALTKSGTMFQSFL